MPAVDCSVGFAHGIDGLCLCVFARASRALGGVTVGYGWGEVV